MFNLIESLERKIGGKNSGSKAFVWLLSDPGMRLLHLNSSGSVPRKFFYEPSPAFLNHTLAVSETFLRITEICKKHKPELRQAVTEPSCWRNYKGSDGKATALKPDLYAVIRNGEYEDNWFIEVDLATEAPCVVLEKCERYVAYHKD